MRISRELWNTIGLGLGIIGVLIIFKWGPPQPSFEKGISIGVEPGTVLLDGRSVDQHDRDVAAEEKFTALMSKVGLGFILVGFVAQFGASLPQRKLTR